METVCCHFLVLQIFWVCDLITQGNEYSREEGGREDGGGDDYRPKPKGSRKALGIKIVCVMIVVGCCL